MSDQPLAFVIMPFGDDFEPIYERFIKPVLSTSGFEVKRADDIESQQNILRDIVESIDSSFLVVADLSTTNPNVFYELGLAHASRKPVILITQSIEEVPFDLRSYRLLEYSVHFDKIDIAKEALCNYARGALNGSIGFGSPVTDFRPDRMIVDQEPNRSVDTNPVEDDRGYLDHLIAINKGYGRIGEIAEGVGSHFQELTLSTSVASDDFKRISANPSDSSAAAARRTARKLAKQVNGFTSKLEESNVEYTDIARDTENSLEFVVSFQREQSDEIDPDIDGQLESLRSLRTVVEEGRDTLDSVAGTMESLPRIERRLNREVARASEEIRVMISNLDRTIASISRALGDQG